MDKFIKVSCKNCDEIFLKDRGHYIENLKLRHNFYCSKKCELEYKTIERQTIRCEKCGKEFKRAIGAISPHNYCSRSCAAIINNKNRLERGAKTIKCRNCGKKFKRWLTGNKKYCSKSCQTNAEFYTTEKLLEIIRGTAKKLKRTPARREFFGGIDKACIKFFGSWNNAILSAGFTPNRSHNNRMYKRARAKAMDGHLCDSISELLIDDWLYKNGVLHQRDARYPGTHHRADWAISIENEKIFVEYFGLANDSPRYDQTIKEKRKLCFKNRISLITIYPQDLYPKEFLEENFKNKFKKFLTA